MSIQPDVKIKGLERSKKEFAQLSQNVSDMRPVWKRFLQWYNKVFIIQTWNTKGKTQGPKWENYRSAAYAKFKGTKSANLILTNKLFNAAKGKSGWVQDLQKKMLMFGIRDSIKYAAAMQYGLSKNNIAERQYLYTREGTLAPKAWTTLIGFTNEHIVEGVE